MSSDPRQPVRDAVWFRSRLLSEVRAFFESRDFLDTPTPLLVNPPALETHINAPKAEGGWLRTSPNFTLKRLMARGHQRIYQIGSCFRAGEFGKRHRPEFTMLEWYEANATYDDLRSFTEELVNHLASKLCRDMQSEYRGRLLSFDRPAESQTVAEAFVAFAGITPEQALANDSFDLLLVDKVEPKLGNVGLEFLTDYPAALSALARLSASNPRVAERWELYAGGLELANAYSELIDEREQRERFEQCARERQNNGQEAYPIDEAFLAEMPNMPPMAGCALGIDRLHMILAGKDDIADVLPSF